jgi:hypothetical protein
MSFKITAESDLWESRGTFTVDTLGIRLLSLESSSIPYILTTTVPLLPSYAWNRFGIQSLNAAVLENLLFTIQYLARLKSWSSG